MSQDAIALRDLVTGALRGLPDLLSINKGLWSLATAKPDRIGSIGLLLEQQARQHPNHPALLFEDRRWSYGEFNAWVNQHAEVLRDMGIGHGDTVALLMENRPETLALVAATVKLGAIAALINHNQRGEVLAHSLTLTNAKLIVVGEECAGALTTTAFRPAKDKARKYFIEGKKVPKGWLDLRAKVHDAGDGNPPTTRLVRQRDTAFYIFTSGTTGMPKASRMTHYRWLRGAAGLGLLSIRLKRDDVFYCCLPLYHNNALTVSWGAVLSSGATLALGRKFSASRFWDELRRYRATSFCYIGELLRYLLNQPLKDNDRDHRVRIIVGNGLRPELWDAFVARFGIEHIAEFYGASEGNAAFVNGFGLSKTAGFCPLPFAIVEFDNSSETPVRGAKGLMQKVPKGGIGLLITEVSDRNPFDGYTDRKASEGKLFRNVFKPGDVWFNTGDLVRDQGFRHIQFVDRVGDTFRWKGENVATTEVEAALNNFAGVREAVVYGVQIPDTDGRAGMAALTIDGPLDGKALSDHLCAQLPAYAVPVFLREKATQETTATFKFRKVDLKREGFDLGQISEPLWVLIDRHRGYEPLTTERFTEVMAGLIRL